MIEADITIIKAKRKSISITVKSPTEVVVRAPYFASKRQIMEFVNSKEAWIKDRQKRLIELEKESGNQAKYSEEDLKRLKKAAKLELIPMLDKYADQMGLSYERVSLRFQKSRWGSCSAKGNINLNCLLMEMPTEIQEYVVVHELAHLKHMNHSKDFWQVVESVLPDYKERRKFLKANGEKYMRRL